MTRNSLLWTLPCALFACGGHVSGGPAETPPEVDSGAAAPDPGTPSGGDAGTPATATDASPGAATDTGAASPGPDAGTAAGAWPVPLGDQPVAISVVGGSVYAALFIEGIVSVPAAGGETTPLVSSAGQGVYFQNGFATDGASLYFSESSGGYTSGLIARAPLGGGPATVLASSLGFTSGIVVDAANVYWTDQDQNTVMRVPLAGGTPATIASGLKSPAALALANGTLYVTDPGGDLLSVPTAGGTVTTLVTGPGIPANTFYADTSMPLVTDERYVYFSQCPSNGVNGVAGVYRVPLGGGTPTMLASGCAMGLAVDADSLYFTLADTVNAVPIAGGAVTVIASGQFLSGGPAVDDANVYWGVTVQLGTCGLCPPPPKGQTNAIVRAPKPATH